MGLCGSTTCGELGPSWIHALALPGLQVNVLSLSICTREAYQSMRERKVDDGHIININRWDRVTTAPEGALWQGNQNTHPGNTTYPCVMATGAGSTAIYLEWQLPLLSAIDAWVGGSAITGHRDKRYHWGHDIPSL